MLVDGQFQEFSRAMEGEEGEGRGLNRGLGWGRGGRGGGGKLGDWTKGERGGRLGWGELGCRWRRCSAWPGCSVGAENWSNARRWEDEQVRVEEVLGRLGIEK